MIINAENLILGRMSTVIAKKALLGESIEIVNTEKAVIIGNKVNILENYLNKIRKGDPSYGPYFPRSPDRLVRRAIRGMLPYKQEKGRSAFKRIRCYIGVPEDLKDKKSETIDNARLSKQHINYMTVKELSKYMGAKNYGS